MKSLIKLQEAIAADILALRQNGKRAAGYGMTFLNRKGRGLGALRRRYYKEAMGMGYSEAMAEAQWGDVKDYARLLDGSQ